MRTVNVPEGMQDLFAKAEEVVSRFFAERADDPTHGTIDIHGERYVLIRGAALSIEFFDLVRSLYGDDKRTEADDFARAILFDLAHSVGKTDARNFHSRMHLTDPIAKLSAGPVHFSHTGWAFVDIFPESRATLDDEYCLVYDHPYAFESDAWLRAGRRSSFPVCVMNAGYSSGWCEESFGQKLVAAEVLCRCKGDDTCRFIMAPPHRIKQQIEAYIAQHPELAARAAGFHIPDFFARKREQEALEQRQQELEHELRQTQKLEALGRLAGGIAHDFNNLMSVVLGQATLSRRRVGDDDPLAQDLSRIIRAAERARALTQQLLTFGRSQVMRNELLDLNAVVTETGHLIERIIGDDVLLTLQLADTAGNVLADRAQLEQVLMNLVVNARDAMPKGGQLTISTRHTDADRVELIVSDTGIGMDEATRLRAFEPFYTTKGSQGTGLGLSTVYGIVTTLKGSVTIDSQPEQGTTVHIILPRMGAQPLNETRTESTAKPGVGTILVVEDQLELRDLIGGSLEVYGYEAILANDVNDALLILADASRHLDLLLTDVVMPHMSGVDLATSATALRPALKVLYMSGYTPDAHHRELFSREGSAYLQKPFAPEELAARVSSLLGGQMHAPVTDR